MASYGYCASHSRRFWVLRLHLITTVHGLPVAFALSTAKTDEREVLVDLFDLDSDGLLTHPDGLILIVDKGYRDTATERLLARRDVTMIRPAYKGEKPRPGRMLLRALLPQLSVAASISDGDSSYSGRLDALALQFVIISPYAVPIGIAGLVALLRRPRWQAYRALAWAWLVVVAVVLLAGGKGYYDAPLLLVLTAAGAVVTAAWAARRATVLRRALLVAAALLFVAPNGVLLLPTLPADRLPGFVVDVNYDAGETIGWPAFADSLAAIHRALPAEQRQRAVILTGNYGEAGAVARYGPARGLPAAYSGHNSMADFGRPPADAHVVIAVGWDRPDPLREWFINVSLAGHVDQRVEVDNDENGGPIWLCTGLRRPWADIWETEVRHAG